MAQCGVDSVTELAQVESCVEDDEEVLYFGS